MKILLLLSVYLMATAFILYAQKPVYAELFEALPKNYNTVDGVTGKALNLTAAAAYRIPMLQKNVLQGYNGNFSVILWAKAAVDAKEHYIITGSNSTDTSKKNSYGWQIGMQPNGAWFCKIWDNGAKYDYSPTPQMQKIIDGKWHQLAFTYDTAKKEVNFYFDGVNKAIIHTPEIKRLMGEQLMIGGLQEGYIGEWETFNGCIDEVKIFKELLSADFFLKEYFQTQGLKIKTLQIKPQPSFSVMNYNIFHGGHETGKEVGLQRIVEIIKSSGADIIAMQETYGSGPAIADALGYYFYLRSSNLSIMSRYPIKSTLPAGAPFNSGGAMIQLPGNRQIAFFNNWITYPVDYWDVFEKGKTIDSTYWYQQQDKVNTASLRNTLEKISASIDDAENVPVIFCGDLNTGSHLDWVEETRHLNNGYVMPFPTTKLLEQKGFVDSYRQLHPNPLKDRGITWSPQIPTAFKDRIDYIFYKSGKIKPMVSTVIETHPVRYPSDHAAVVTKFEWVK